MSYIKVKKLRKEAVILSKRDEDAAYDIYWVFEKDCFLLNPWDIYTVPTGIAIEISKDKVFYICERWSTGTKWIARRCWVVDSWYRWEIFVPLNNTWIKPIVFYKDEKQLKKFVSENQLTDFITYPQNKAIAQGMILNIPEIQVEVVDELSESERMDGALWSTKK